MEALNHKIKECLEQEKNFSIATIMAHKGSTPRTSGAKIIVLRDRTIFGTIGGGLVEANVINMCINCLEKGSSLIHEFNLDHQSKKDLDMICGGNITVLIESFLFNDSANSSWSNAKLIFQTLSELEAKGEKAFLISKIYKGTSVSDFSTLKSLIMSDGSVKGAALVPPKELIEEVENNIFSKPLPVIYKYGFEEWIIEPVLPRSMLYIFGAGHVGYQLAKIAYIVDFQTVILDDRKEFANSKRFPHAIRVIVLDDFKKAFDNLSIEASSYLVIATRGHLYDQTVLAQALKTEATYIGMLGSKSKRDKIYANLTKQGVSKQNLDRVFCPIGLDINSETPGEIAISIMGQIIRKKNILS